MRRETHLVMSQKCVRVFDDGQGIARHGCSKTEVRCTTGFEKVKPKCCFVDRVADRQ